MKQKDKNAVALGKKRFKTLKEGQEHIAKIRKKRWLKKANPKVSSNQI